MNFDALKERIKSSDSAKQALATQEAERRKREKEVGTIPQPMTPLDEGLAAPADNYTITLPANVVAEKRRADEEAKRQQEAEEAAIKARAKKKEQDAARRKTQPTFLGSQYMPFAVRIPTDAEAKAYKKAKNKGDPISADEFLESIAAETPEASVNTQHEEKPEEMPEEMPEEENKSKGEKEMPETNMQMAKAKPATVPIGVAQLQGFMPMLADADNSCPSLSEPIGDRNQHAKAVVFLQTVYDDSGSCKGAYALVFDAGETIKTTSFVGKSQDATEFLFLGVIEAYKIAIENKIERMELWLENEDVTILSQAVAFNVGVYSRTREAFGKMRDEHKYKPALALYTIDEESRNDERCQVAAQRAMEEVYGEGKND